MAITSRVIEKVGESNSFFSTGAVSFAHWCFCKKASFADSTEDCISGMDLCVFTSTFAANATNSSMLMAFPAPARALRFGFLKSLMESFYALGCNSSATK